MIIGRYYDAWLKDIGRSRMTGYRWRKQGRIKVERIYGRNFVRQEEIDRFFREGADK
jgi:hypothetical protein